MNDALYHLIRSHYRELQGYVSAGMESGKDESKIFMNANENPYSLPGLEGLNRYPEPQPARLLEVYARAYGLPEEHIFMSRGADESIALLSRIFCEPRKDAVIIHPPTFGIYKVYTGTVPGKILEVPLIKTEGRFKLDTEGIISTAQKGQDCVKLIYLCSPNNPTGTSFPREEILKICKAVEGKSIVILDEAYVEFSQSGSLVPELGTHPNLIILRTLSKAYSLAGARMGVTLCADPDFIAFMRTKASETYPLPKGSVEAALKALSMKETVERNIQSVLAQRDRMRETFEGSPLVTHVYPSDANFLLVEMKDAKGFLDFCAENNIILRDFSDKPGTENALRISVGTPEENDLVLKLLNGFETDSYSQAL